MRTRNVLVDRALPWDPRRPAPTDPITDVCPDAHCAAPAVRSSSRPPPHGGSVGAGAPGSPRRACGACPPRPSATTSGMPRRTSSTSPRRIRTKNLFGRLAALSRGCRSRRCIVGCCRPSRRRSASACSLWPSRPSVAGTGLRSRCRRPWRPAGTSRPIKAPAAPDPVRGRPAAPASRGGRTASDPAGVNGTD